MTAAQKRNAERFKKVQAEAKKLKAKNKNLSHIEAVKKAWAMMPKAKATPSTKRKKKVGATMFVERGESPKKRPTKVVVVKRATKKSASGNKPGTFEKFKTVGSVKIVSLNDLSIVTKKILNIENSILKLQNDKLNYAKTSFDKKAYQEQINDLKKYLSELKKHKTELKKLL